MKFAIFLAFAACAFTTCAGQVTRVKLDIFYESLCPDTSTYIQTLWGLYPAFRDNLDITFYPFGKSNSSVNEDGVVEFTCRNRGAPECFGNRVQGCVLRSLDTQDAQMEYIACQMTNNATLLDVTHERCVGEIPMLWYPILECASYDLSESQQLTFERISTPVIDETNWVPTVLYNGKLVDISITREAPPLRDVICSYINNENPECTA